MSNKKIPLIPPVFHEICNRFQENTDFFNLFFEKQCFLISNSSEIPLNLHYLTEKRLDTLKFFNNDIEKNIQNLDPRRTMKISIRMGKICGKSTCKTQELIFNQTGSFSLGRKESQCSPSSSEN